MAAALGPPAPVQAKARRVTEDSQEEKEEERKEIAVREQLASAGLMGLGGPPTIGPARSSLPVQEEGEDAKADARAGPEENLIPEVQASPQSTGQARTGPMLGSSTASVLQSQATSSSPGDPTKPSTHTILTTAPHDAAPVLPTQEVPKQPPVLPHRPEEDTDPNSVHSVPRGNPEGKSFS